MERLAVCLVAMAVIVMALPWLLAYVSAGWLVVVLAVVAAGLVGRHLRRHGG